MQSTLLKGGEQGLPAQAYRLRIRGGCLIEPLYDVGKFAARQRIRRDQCGERSGDTQRSDFERLRFSPGAEEQRIACAQIGNGIAWQHDAEARERRRLDMTVEPR